MATRQIKDAKDLSTGNLIYFKGHAQATFMSDGRTVEDAINNVSGGTDDYIFPFTTQDIIDATERDEPIRLFEGDITEILDAINTKKRILIRQYPDVEGYNVIDSIYWDDMIYVHFVDLYSSDSATSCDFVIDMNAMNVTDFRMETIARENNLKTINGESIVGSGNLNLATTEQLGAKQDKLVSGTNIITINNNSILGSGNLNLATTEQLRSFQPTLVSGTNIKTINSTSLLGSGNIAIKDTKNLTYSLNNSTSGTVTLLPNVCIYMPNVLTGKLAINACSTISSNNADLIESRICFRMPNNAILPVIQFNGVAIRWAGGNAPTFEPDFTYEVSLFYPSNANNVGPMGVCVGFK